MAHIIVKADKSKCRRTENIIHLSLSPRAGEVQCHSLTTVRQRERILSYLAFYSNQTRSGLGEAHHIGESRLFYSVYQFKCYSHPEPPLQTYPDITFNQVYGHPVTQSNCHIKLTITPFKRSQG